MNTHEDFSRKAEIPVSSDRTFGLVFTVVCAVIGLWPLHAAQPVRVWVLVMSGGLLVISLMSPKLLNPLNRLWARIGFLLHKVVSPVVTALIFYIVFTPTGFLLRLAGKDLLRLRFDRNAETYWILRDPPGPAPETMSNPF